jgi:hypothetical protein
VRRLQPFNESEWLACTDPLVLIQWEGPQATNRKLRLFACACCRLVWDRLTAPRTREAVEVAERFADGLVTAEDLLAAFRGVARDGSSWTDLGWAARDTASWRPAYNMIVRDVLAAQTAPGTVAALLRDIIGNPFRPLAARRFPAHIEGLARACHDAFPASSPEFAILADALEELGEWEAATHCREPLHARGCHVLDWVLVLT